MPSSAEKLFYDLLGGIREGCLIVRDPQGRKRTFGTEGTTPTARLLVHNGDLYSRLLRDADLGLGESYMDGWWDEENGRIVDLMAIILNNGIKERGRRSLRLKMRFLYRWLLTLPTLSTSRKNARFHYDSGNDFFELFLDPSMTYSCGYQRRSEDTLYRMQMQKYELTCRKLALQPGDRLIDIGCGWGSMLIYAAKEYGVSGLGVTLSPQQQAWGRRRIEEEGLSGRLEVRLQDYREVEGTFDKFVSIGMFEHVGKEYYGTFMRKVYNLLKPDGIGLLHTIGSTGSRFPGDWIRTYIFPGTRLPRLGDLTEEMRQGGLTVGHIENWKLHYAETTRHWKENFHANREKIAALDRHYDERFLRMWDYYLQLLEGCFRYDTLQLYQVLFCQGRRWTLPLCFNFHDADAGDRCSRTLDSRAREDLVKTRVTLANRLRAELEAFWPGATRVFADLDSQIALAFIERYPSPQDAHRLGEKRLLGKLRSARARPDGQDLAKSLDSGRAPLSNRVLPVAPVHATPPSALRRRERPSPPEPGPPLEERARPAPWNTRIQC